MSKLISEKLHYVKLSYNVKGILIDYQIDYIILGFDQSIKMIYKKIIIIIIIL